MCDTCDDSRFELIEKYKQKLLDATNIGDSPEEMAVIDDILFRFWQMGWLNLATDTISRAGAIETVRKAKSIGQAHRMLAQLPSVDAVEVVRCKDCKYWRRDADHTCKEHSLVSPMLADGFCSRGERKDGDGNG